MGTDTNGGGVIYVDTTPPPPACSSPPTAQTWPVVSIWTPGASDPLGVTKVEFHLSGGSLKDAIIATGTLTCYGWLASWNTTTVPNGSYTLQSVAYDAAGMSAHSASITITVNNSPPTTKVLRPSNGATVSGGQYLDASASSGVNKVEFPLRGGSLNDVVIATGTPTYYGWIGGWDTTTVPKGTYTLQSVAYYAGGVSGRSTGITVTVAN